MLERVKHENTVDIYGHVTVLRTQRNFMVQNEVNSSLKYAILKLEHFYNQRMFVYEHHCHLQKLSIFSYVTYMNLRIAHITKSANVFFFLCPPAYEENTDPLHLNSRMQLLHTAVKVLIFLF